MNTSDDGVFISDRSILIYQYVSFGVLCQIINIFGIVTNTINIICFAKQGFQDSVNISLLGLAISDICCLVTMVWTCICFTPGVIAADLPFEPLEVAYLASAMPHLSFTRVSSCITAMITTERCLCITAPLKVKSMITPTRSVVIIVCIFIIFFCSGAPMYTVNKLAFKFSPLRNKTLLGIVSTEDRETVEMISFAVNNFSIPFGAFFIIVVCTAILSFKLHIKSKWRKKTISSKQADIVSSRSQKVAKMVVMISILFIVCFVPLSIIMLAMAFIPALSLHMKSFSITVLIAGFGSVMESLNSSMNIFIYYRMSSKYREIFSKLFYKSRSVKQIK